MSKVYFTDFRATEEENLLQKLHRLLKTANFESIDFNKKFVALKLHLGEPGNIAYLRPNYVKVVADYVKQLRGKPFLTDCNTLYVGRRKNAIDHLKAAYENGFNPFAPGCHVMIADGLKGHDEKIVPINQKHVKQAKIGHAVMDADVFISLTHFKGHENTGFGGAIKNIGMGCGSRGGKMEMHYAGKPRVNPDMCVSCAACYRNCAFEAISFINKKAFIDVNKCVGCGRCIGACNYDAISPINNNSNILLNEKMAEYAYAVLKDRPQYHISFITDVSPNCDCHVENDVPVVPNIGMLASFDPVALDQACADLVNAAPINPNSRLAEVEHKHGDHFKDLAPNTDWQTCLAHAEEIGVGERKYDLIEI